ncbi:MAG: primosomal protein N' [Caldimicrobium sp.]
MYLLEVALPLPLFKNFHYLSSQYVIPGARVVVPFGSQKLVGIVWNVEEAAAEKLDPKIEYKEIDEVLDPLPLYPQKFFPFLEWVSKYYFSPLGIVLKTALPSGVFKIPERRIFLTSEGEKALKKGVLPEAFTALLENKKCVSLKNFTKKYKIPTRKIKEWVRLGLLDLKVVIPQVRVPVEVFYRLKRPLKGDLKEKLEPLFLESEEVPERTLKESISLKKLRKLIEEGVLEKIEIPKTRRIIIPTEVLKDYELTSKQKSVFNQLVLALKEGRFKPFLLYGVTGSGKSLIYLELIKEALKEGKRVLFLLPEIALTHFIEKVLYQHFKERLALLHSALTPQQRLSEWMKVLDGRADIIIGTRSSVFAPVENLGLIIVDEEHDPSYKEENLPCKYHARDLALVKGKMEGALVLLGSATPSIKSYYFAKTGKYHLLTLTERPFVNMPEVKLVLYKKGGIITKEVKKEVEKTLHKGRSVFVYLNRRGYAPLVKCEECGFVWECPNCGISLTYHKDEDAILCHYCSFSLNVKILCPQCKRGKWKFLRFGTERIEEILKSEFPGVEVVRFDRDSVSSEKRLSELFEKLYTPFPKIIVGTQMGVHGHNFPQVNLVVVLRAEEGLFLPHYKASERTFQLLLQAEGRAGRKDERGRVLIQTSLPEHYVITKALSQDYEGFFYEELLQRKKYGFPPFKKLAVIRFEGVNEDKIKEKAIKLKEKMEEIKLAKKFALEILGPSPCPLRKLRGLYRWQILIKGDTSKEIHAVLEPFKEEKYTGIKMEIDVDPEDLL